MIIRAPGFLILGLFFLLLSACGRSPSAKFYTLESSPAELTPSTDERAGVSLGLRQVILPSVLKQPQIVLIDEERVEPLEFHRWSEPLDLAMSRVLNYELGAQLNSALVFSYPWPAEFKPEQTLTVKVSRFNGLPDKNVELAGVWLLSQEGVESPIKIVRFYIVEKVKGNDYSALVRAHSAAVQQLAEQLVKVISAQ